VFQTAFLKKLNLFFAKNYFFMLLDHFNELVSKMIFLKMKKNTILMHFRAKSILKSNRYHTLKHHLQTEMKLIF